MHTPDLHGSKIGSEDTGHQESSSLPSSFLNLGYHFRGSCNVQVTDNEFRTDRERDQKRKYGRRRETLPVGREPQRCLFADAIGRTCSRYYGERLASKLKGKQGYSSPVMTTTLPLMRSECEKSLSSGTWLIIGFLL